MSIDAPTLIPPAKGALGDPQRFKALSSATGIPEIFFRKAGMSSHLTPEKAIATVKAMVGPAAWDAANERDTPLGRFNALMGGCHFETRRAEGMTDVVIKPGKRAAAPVDRGPCVCGYAHRPGAKFCNACGGKIVADDGDDDDQGDEPGENESTMSYTPPPSMPRAPSHGHVRGAAPQSWNDRVRAAAADPAVRKMAARNGMDFEFFAVSWCAHGGDGGPTRDLSGAVAEYHAARPAQITDADRQQAALFSRDPAEVARSRQALFGRGQP